MKLKASKENQAARIRLDSNAQKEIFSMIMQLAEFSDGQLTSERRSSARKSKITSFSLTKSLAEL